MLTGDPLKLTVSALGFILMGMFTGNTILLCLGLITLIFLYAALEIQPPTNLQHLPPPESIIAYVDDEQTITHQITVEKAWDSSPSAKTYPPTSAS